MKILILNHHIGSTHYGMDYRQYYLAREWVRLGHEVTILGASYSHLRQHQPEVRTNLQEEWIEGIRYLWIKTPPYRTSGYRRILNMIAFVLKSILWYRRIERTVKPDTVMAASTYVLDIYPAWLISRKSGAKLLYDLHDLWPLSPVIIGGYSRFHPFIIMIQMAENFACRKCDLFISVLGNAKDYLVKHGMKDEKFIAVPNGFSEEDYQEAGMKVPADHEKLLMRLRAESRIIVGYAGGHAPSNALNSLIQAAKLSEDGKLAFVLVGSGSQKEELIRTARELQGKNVFFLPPVPKKAIPDLLGYCDILYAGGVSSILHRYGTAFNKVTDYLLAGKPVVFAVDEPDSLIGQAGCGIQVPAENSEEIAWAIKFLADLGPEGRLAMGARGRDYAWRELGYSTIAKKILEATRGHEKVL